MPPRKRKTTISSPNNIPASPAVTPERNIPVAKFDPTIIYQSEDEDLAPRTRGDRRAVDLDPFKELVRQSFESGKGKCLKVPATQVKELTKFLRAAGAALFDEGIGVRLQYSWDDHSPSGSYKDLDLDDENMIVKVGYAGGKPRGSVRYGN